MLKTLCYIGDKGTFEYIAASESGRLATRTQNPFAKNPEVQDLERVMKAKYDAADQKPEGLGEMIEQIHQYNENVSTYERVRYIKSLTPALAQTLEVARTQCDARSVIRTQQNQHTILDMKLKVVKVEKDGE
jgi:alpha-glucuronidase